MNYEYNIAEFGDFEVAGVVFEGDWLATGTPESDADAFGVYQRLPPEGDDGHRYAKHIADFDVLEVAMEYAAWRDRLNRKGVQT